MQKVGGVAHSLVWTARLSDTLEIVILLFITFITIILVFYINLAISFTRISGSQSSDKLGK